MEFEEAHQIASGIVGEVGRVVVGKAWELTASVATLLGRGHVLIEGPPGAAKTLMAKSLARAIGGVFKRIQGNPDITPSDILGFHVYTLEGGSRLVKGPIFANIVLYDELNRTPTRSQAALLEAIEERQATIDGVTYPLPQPFMLIATEMPGEISRGTYPLTLTLIDRFAVKIGTGHNRPEEEYEIVRRVEELVSEQVEPVATPGKLVELTEYIARKIHVDGRVVKYIVDLASHIRSHEDVVSLSHRGPISLYRVSKAYALLEKRDYVIPDDVKKFAVACLAHRIVLRDEAGAAAREDIVREALNTVKVPKE